MELNQPNSIQMAKLPQPMVQLRLSEGSISKACLQFLLRKGIFALGCIQPHVPSQCQWAITWNQGSNGREGREKLFPQWKSGASWFMRLDSKGAKYTQLGTASWGEEWRGDAFHSQETSGMSQPWGQQREGGKMQVPSFWEELTGVLSLVNWPKVLSAFLSLNSCNSVMQLTPPLGESQIEHYSMETHQEFPSIILIN